MTARPFCILIIILFLSGLVSFGQITPTNLTCEYMQNPAVVDVKQPRLAWLNIAENGERGQKQTAYQIRVAISKEKLAASDLWDSQKTFSDQSNRITYLGKDLLSEQECWWQVRVWDKEDKVSKWSEPAFWRMGLLETSDWKAEWIGAPWQSEQALPKPIGGPDATQTDIPPPAPLFRKPFSIEKEVESAVAFVTGLGYFELYLNGQKVGNDLLVPNQTNYGKRPNLKDANIAVEDNFRGYKVMYLAYDITKNLKEGENVIGAILGNGFYNPSKYWTEGYGSPRFLTQIHVKYKDGTDEIVVSNKSWKVSKSPILMDMVYYGEIYDARLEQEGWSSPGFDDSAWKFAVNRTAPEGKLVAHTFNPDRVTQQIKPVKIEKTADGKYLVDFGVEISGWVRFMNIEGPSGHKISIKFNGNSYSGDNAYIFNGKSVTSYAPRFNWFVFSGLEISNWPGDLKPEQLVAEAVNTDVKETAHFETSSTLFNNINKIWQRSQLDNMHGGVASDCPHRERSAYTGDGQVACATVMHNFDAQNFYHKWIQDIFDSQDISTGYVPNGAPWQPGCGGGVAWGAAICIMPWEFYLHYGAKDILEDNYVGMKEYVRYMQSWVDKDGIMFSQRKGKDGKLLKWFNLGEWVAPGNLPPDDMVHTFYFWRCADITAQTAKALNRLAEAKQYATLAEMTLKAFQKRFYDVANGTYGKFGGNIFALKMGVPKEQYERVKSALKSDIKAADGHLDTGIFGTQFFFEVLSENGMHDLAYQAMNKQDKPSYGHWLELGSTTTREQWGEEGSHNHPMFGGGLVWFYRKLAGMNTDTEAPGYRHIIFHPQPVPELSFVKYYNDTPYGEAGIYWKNEEQQFLAELLVPVGCRATVYVPILKKKKITESGKQISTSAEIRFLREEEGYRLFTVESGQYQFLSE